ncbi:MAG: hypothetical protein OJF49_000879 [Ktedonobacterales bacterium]|nr:MAG: hypothetical protein OJF49_000879 [Ktedonobacterales bacterium]
MASWLLVIFRALDAPSHHVLRFSVRPARRLHPPAAQLLRINT